MIHSSFLQMIRVITNKEALTTSQNVVILVANREEIILVGDLVEAEEKDKCTLLLVASVVMKLLFLSNHVVIARYIVVTVLGISVPRIFASFN